MGLENIIEILYLSMGPEKRMRNLIKYLPKGDIVLAQRFIDSRDFESLKELVDSAIIKVRRNLKSNNPKEEYLSLDIDVLARLKAEVDVYTEQLQLPYQNEIDDYEEEY